MARVKDETEKTERKVYDQLDVKKLKEATDAIKQERINGRLQSRFDIHCANNNIVRFGEHGETIVRDPHGYHTLCEMWAIVERAANRKAFAERKDLEERDKLAQQMNGV